MTPLHECAASDAARSARILAAAAAAAEVPIPWLQLQPTDELMHDGHTSARLTKRWASTARRRCTWQLKMMHPEWQWPSSRPRLM